MMRAIELSKESVLKGGGPFGAVIAKDGEIVAEGSNRVTIDNDPTAHGEITAIRAATKKLGTFDLKGCEIYTSCEPCPMCLGAIYWARLDKIYFANDRKDAAAIGFEILFKRLSSRDDTDCPRAEVCRRNGAYEYECKYDQWNHSSPCPFSSALHYFHLEGKQFEQRRAEEK